VHTARHSPPLPTNQPTNHRPSPTPITTTTLKPPPPPPLTHHHPNRTLSRPVHQVREGETDNFDKEFTSESVRLTPPDMELIDSIDQREFDGFSFVNAAYKR
jgi:hypothetical protein